MSSLLSRPPKIIVILGPTASGKTELAIALAKKFSTKKWLSFGWNGAEIISADSRQVYKKMAIGSGRPPGRWRQFAGGPAYSVSGVPHYLMDWLDPGKELSAARFKDLALERVREITSRGRLPIVVGGTGLYIRALVDNLDMPRVPANKKLRLSLEKKTLPELAVLLRRIDPETFAVIDLKNPRRLLRALEVAILTGESFSSRRGEFTPRLVDALQIGLSWEPAELRRRIERRVREQLKLGLAAETKKLLRQNYSWKLPAMSGIGYREVASYLAGEMTLAETGAKIVQATCRYAKRQMTWFKRDKRVVWIGGENVKAAEKLVKEFLQCGN